jgi:hypothetical protein
MFKEMNSKKKLFVGSALFLTFFSPLPPEVPVIYTLCLRTSPEYFDTSISTIAPAVQRSDIK